MCVSHFRRKIEVLKENLNLIAAKNKCKGILKIFAWELLILQNTFLDHTFLRKQMTDFTLHALTRVCFFFYLGMWSRTAFFSREPSSHNAYQLHEQFSGIGNII